MSGASKGAARDQGRAPRLLIVAWEYPGLHTPGGAALSRRVGQLARGFAASGWTVQALVRVARRNVSGTLGSLDGVERIAVPGSELGADAARHHPLVRRALTAWHAVRHGDRSYEWVPMAERSALEHVERPDLIIGSFTPRAPLAVAARLARHWKVPWIADLQDPTFEGVQGPADRLTLAWMRRVVRSAHAVVQVSPEWARMDAERLGRPVVAIRHAVPPAPDVGPAPAIADPMVLLHAGSANPGFQRPEVLMAGLAEAEHGVELRVAGRPEVAEYFAGVLNGRARDLVRPLGWLDPTALAEQMAAANVLVLLASSRKGWPLAPSKLFEYLAFNRPILVAGEDSGGMASLYEELGHPDVTCLTAGQVREALALAREGDTSRLFTAQRCARRPLDERGLIDAYLELAASAGVR